MALIDEVKSLCDRLAPVGWRDLLLAVTRGRLDIVARDSTTLAGRLTNSLAEDEIDRGFPGFEDFSQGATAGIVPGSPARSLLFHAFASPGVLTTPDRPRDNEPSSGHSAAAQKRLAGFATLCDLDMLENYIFAARKIKLRALYEETGNKKLFVVVFASEYRPAKDTCSGLQADMVFSRTGISRVGTANPLYDTARRGFWPEDESSPFAIRSCPCRYSAYLAVKVKGDVEQHIPMRHQPSDAKTNPLGDKGLDFWQPVHKLFDGKECLMDEGLDLKVTFTAQHVNEKIRRIHTVALGEKEKVAWSAFPYQFSDGIAELSVEPQLGPGVLVPVVHPRLLEPARTDDAVTFEVPKRNGSRFGSFEPRNKKNNRDDFGEIRPCPAYIHARMEVGGKSENDLNNDSSRPDVRAVVDAGGYAALHYVDFTADGEITVKCDGLKRQKAIEPVAIAAYSLVSAPDFFPSAGQRDLRVDPDSSGLAARPLVVDTHRSPMRHPASREPAASEGIVRPKR